MNIDLPRSISATIQTVKADFNYYRNRLQISSFIKSLLLICLFHPGWQLLFSIRIQEQLGRIPYLGSLLRRCLWYITSLFTSTEINIFARFGNCVYFPHPTGIVIGDTWDIGNYVTLMQGVTLGRKDSITAPINRSKIEDGVTVCAGAVVVGELVVGEGSIIGANAVVLENIPPESVAVGVPARVIHRK